MKQRIAKVQWRLMKYGMFTGIVGDIGSFVGPLDSALHNTLLGVVFGAMLLGCRLNVALKELYAAVIEFTDDFFND